MLKITNLHTKIGDKTLHKGLSLEIKPGEVHVIMGPNGAGKSSLSHVLAGKPEYEVREGEVQFCGENMFLLSPEIRARMGLFVAFQYPIEIPGVSTETFLRVALNEQRTYKGLPTLDAIDFQDELQRALSHIPMRHDLLRRSVNEGFSGGEKKRHEMLQLALLQPKLAILDETDSGLDVDALREVAEGVNAFRNGERSFLLITHYQKLMTYIVPDVVHIMIDGQIIATGGMELAERIEQEGYGALLSK